jgi:hypothetical protein
MPRTSSASSGRGGGESRKKKLYGITEARLHPEPLRQINRNTSYGYDVIDFAEAIGQPLHPWQQWAVKRGMEINRDGTYRFRILLIMVARQNGKSHLVRMMTLWRMLFDQDCKLVLGTAQDLAQASNQWKLTLRMIQQVPSLARRLDYHRHVNGQEAFGLTNGSEYMVRSASPDAGRGFSVDGLILDELRTHRDRKAWSALYYTTTARPNPLTICVSNAGDENSVVLNQLRDAALSGRDETIGLFEWSAPEGCDMWDVQGWRHANPLLGYRISEASLRTSATADKPEDFRTEALCQYVPQLDGAIDLTQWDACADPGGTLDAHRRQIVACFDVAPDSGHCTLAIAAAPGDGVVRVEITSAWDSTEQARAQLGPLLDQIKPVAIAWYPTGPGGALHSILRRRQGSTELTGNKVAEVCQELADLVKAHRVIHPGDILLDTQVRGACRQRSGDTWRFGRTGQADVDAVYAVAGAASLALTLPPPRRARIRLIT